MKNWTSAELAAVKSGVKPLKQKAKTSQLSGAGAIEARRKAQVLVGIDPGTNTGLAVKERGKFIEIQTTSIFKAIEEIRILNTLAFECSVDIFVRVEDARKRTWFGNTGKERLKGAGSVERDCAIWEEVLTELNIPFEMVHPKEVKETTAKYFAKISGWKGRTSKHSREAAWLVLNF